MSRQPPRPSLIDRAILALSPAWALKRHQARGMMALSGGYVGAGYADRFSHWMPGGGDADSDSVSDLRELRGRSRDLVRNSSIATGAIETHVIHVIGTGLTVQSRIDAQALGLTPQQASQYQAAFEREFALWAESTYCDATEEQTFYELQDLAARSELESGDVAALLVDVAGRPSSWPYRLAIQIIEADRISNPENRGDSDKLVQGVERNERGAPVALHIADKHPGRRFFTNGTKWQRVPVRGSSGRLNVIHLKRKLRPGQTRGIPALAPVIALLKQLDRFATAEVDAAVNSAAMAVFVKMDAEAFETLFDDAARGQVISQTKSWDGSVASGKAVQLLPGEEIQTPTPGRPNPEFDPFFTACLKQIGIGLNVPYEVLAKHFSSSYSAARAALLDAWRTFRVRRERFASRFCQPIYEEFLAEAISIGRLSAPGFFADPAIRRAWCGSKWSGDGPGSIDPSKEAEAAGKRMELGITTLAEETVAYDGGDWEQKQVQRQREVELRRGAGLEQDPAAAAPPDTTNQPSRAA